MLFVFVLFVKGIKEFCCSAATIWRGVGMEVCVCVCVCRVLGVYIVWGWVKWRLKWGVLLVG